MTEVDNDLLSLVSGVGRGSLSGVLGLSGLDRFGDSLGVSLATLGRLSLLGRWVFGRSTLARTARLGCISVTTLGLGTGSLGGRHGVFVHDLLKVFLGTPVVGMSRSLLHASESGEFLEVDLCGEWY